jgi:hypothetical protein
MILPPKAEKAVAKCKPDGHCRAKAVEVALEISNDRGILLKHFESLAEILELVVSRYD